MAVDLLERISVATMTAIGVDPKNRPAVGFVVAFIATDDDTVNGLFPDGTVGKLYNSGAALTIVGNLDPLGGNIDYPAAVAGDTYLFNSAGTIGAPAVVVEIGDMLITTATTVGGAGAGGDFVIQQVNIVDATEITCGVSCIATQSETNAGVIADKFVPPLKLITLLGTDGLDSIVTDRITNKTNFGVPIPLIFDTKTPIDNISSNEINVKTGKTQDGGGNVPTTGIILLKSGDGGSTSTNGNNSGESGLVKIITGEGGTPIANDGDGGDSGHLLLETGNAGNKGATLGNGAVSGQIQITSGNGGNGVNGGSSGDLLLLTGAGGIADAGPGVDGLKGQLIMGSFISNSFIENNMTAFGGGGIGNATQITRTYNRITTVALVGDSVKLPEAKTKFGTEVRLRNDGANALDVFPPNGAQQINGAGIGIAVSLAAGNSILIVRMDAINWVVFD